MLYIHKITVIQTQNAKHFTISGNKHTPCIEEELTNNQSDVDGQ